MKAIRKRTKLASSVAAAINLVWGTYNSIVSAANLPADSSDAWKAIVSVPEYWPICLAAISLGALAWSIWWPDKVDQSTDPLNKVGDPIFITHGDSSNIFANAGPVYYGDIQSKKVGPDELSGAVNGPIFKDILDREFEFEFRVRNDGGENAIITQIECYFFTVSPLHPNPAYGGNTDAFKAISGKSDRRWDVVGLSLLLPRAAILDGHSSQGSSIPIAPAQERLILATFDFPEESPQAALFYLVPVISFSRSDHSRHSAYMDECPLWRSVLGDASIPSGSTGWLNLMERSKFERRSGTLTAP